MREARLREHLNAFQQPLDSDSFQKQNLVIRMELDPDSKKRRFEDKEEVQKEKKPIGFMEDVVIKKSRLEREKEEARK